MREVQIDGNLQECLCDIEDRNVTLWIHARPHVLASDDGRTADASAVAYVGADGKHLYLAVQVVDDDPSPQDRLVIDFGKRHLVARWNPAGRPVLTDEKGRPIPGGRTASQPPDASARNPDLGRIQGLTPGQARS